MDEYLESFASRIINYKQIMKNKDLTCEAWDLFNYSRQSVKKEHYFYFIFFTL